MPHDIKGFSWLLSLLHWMEEWSLICGNVALCQGSRSGNDVRESNTPICLITNARTLLRIRWLNEIYECLLPLKEKHTMRAKLPTQHPQINSELCIYIPTFIDLINKTRSSSENDIIENIVSHILNNKPGISRFIKY